MVVPVATVVLIALASPHVALDRLLAGSGKCLARQVKDRVDLGVSRVASVKRQAASVKRQAASAKRQAASAKRQVASDRLPAVLQEMV